LISATVPIIYVDSRYNLTWHKNVVDLPLSFA